MSSFALFEVLKELRFRDYCFSVRGKIYLIIVDKVVIIFIPDFMGFNF